MKYYTAISLQHIALYDWLKAMHIREMTEHVTEKKISGYISLFFEALQSFLISFSRTESPVLHTINHWSMRNLSSIWNSLNME